MTRNGGVYTTHSQTLPEGFETNLRLVHVVVCHDSRLRGHTLRRNRSVQSLYKTKHVSTRSFLQNCFSFACLLPPQGERTISNLRLPKLWRPVFFLLELSLALCLVF